MSACNIAVNMLFKKEVTGLYCLTWANVQEGICLSKINVVTHIQRWIQYANWYQFCHYLKTKPVFNTDTSLEYIQVSISHDWLY